jgi:hypothetical protein
MRSSFYVVLCGEVVNICVHNISDSTKPENKRYTGALCVFQPHICFLTLPPQIQRWQVCQAGMPCPRILARFWLVGGRTGIMSHKHDQVGAFLKPRDAGRLQRIGNGSVWCTIRPPNRRHREAIHVACPVPRKGNTPVGVHRKYQRSHKQ